MIKLLNNWIVVTKDDVSYFPLCSNLTILEKSRRLRNKNKNKRDIIIPEKRIPLFYKSDNESIFIPAGLYSLIENYFNNSKIIDMRKRTNLSDTDMIIKNIDSYSDILEGIKLRTEQLLAIRKILIFKRCIIQMTTGSGKSEVMCAFLKIISSINNYMYPTTLVIEPTKKLQFDIANRFSKYEIPTTNYSNNRMIIPNCINICHPTSLGNDIDKNPDILNDVQILIGDETHHMKSDSWRKPTYNMNNLEYSIGLSASAICQEHVGKNNISDYNIGELFTIGATGKLVMNVKSASMISNERLANPVLIMIDNPANEKLETGNLSNWADIAKNVLESEHRVDLVCRSAKIFSDSDRKVLILVRTVRWARLIMEKLYEYGLGDITRGSYGGGRFEYYNGEEFLPDVSDVFNGYSTGRFNILIGTQHIYEGVDIPNLDVVILAYAGKSERVHVQGIGRALRKTKNGKYAYIVDFYDRENPILYRHSITRLMRYKEVVGIPDEHMYVDIDIEDVSEIFKNLEN